jgi:Flp pilus assembly protein TadB
MVNPNSDKIIELELKKLEIKREKARLVLDKCIWLYFLFMIIGVLGFIYGYVSTLLLNVLIIAAFLILIVGTMPYATAVSKEEKDLDKFIEQLRK